jgi:hypothetical protein
MAIVLIVIGAVLLDAGVRDKQSELWGQLQKDFSPSAQQPGQHSFLAWFAAIMVLGALGYVPQLQAFSRTFMLLVIVALFLSNGGFFADLQKEFGR